MPRAKKRESPSQKLGASLVFILVFVGVQLLLTTAVALVYLAGFINNNDLTFMSYAASSIAFSASVLVYMAGFRRISGKNISYSLGFSRDRLLRNIGLGLMIFSVILIIEIIVTLISIATNIQINTNVANLFQGAPIWFYAFISLIAPINEEIIFRGFMVPRIGVLPSALLFGIAHYSYMSTFGIEVISAFIFALIAGYVFKRTKSIYPGMVAHIIINTLGVFATFG